MVDTRDLKSLGYLYPYRFKSGPRYNNNKGLQRVVTTVSPFFIYGKSWRQLNAKNIFTEMETDSKDKFIPVSRPGGIPGTIIKGFTESENNL